jgi:hypothetical protein
VSIVACSHLHSSVVKQKSVDNGVLFNCKITFEVVIAVTKDLHNSLKGLRSGNINVDQIVLGFVAVMVSQLSDSPEQIAKSANVIEMGVRNDDIFSFQKVKPHIMGGV